MKKGGWASGTWGPRLLFLGIGKKIVYFSAPPLLPKSKGFPFLVCEMKEGHLGKCCGWASTHIPVLSLGGSRPCKMGNSLSGACPQTPAVAGERERRADTWSREAPGLVKGVGTGLVP